MPSVKYALPPFLVGHVGEAAFIRWLDRKAVAHRVRDRERGNATATRESYMVAIHAAVVQSGGLDAYTGTALRWDQISTYDNEAATQGGRAYKKQFADMPTVDHVGDGLGAPDFVICSWRTNDCKSDLSHDELLAFCRAILGHHESRRSPLP